MTQNPLSVVARCQGAHAEPTGSCSSWGPGCSHQARICSILPGTARGRRLQQRALQMAAPPLPGEGDGKSLPIPPMYVYCLQQAAPVLTHLTG